MNVKARLICGAIGAGIVGIVYYASGIPFERGKMLALAVAAAIIFAVLGLTCPVFDKEEK